MCDIINPNYRDMCPIDSPSKIREQLERCNNLCLFELLDESGEKKYICTSHKSGMKIISS